MKVLDHIYRASGALAAFFMVLIALLTLSQIIGRILNILVPDAGIFAGFCMAASSFLALAYTLRTGGHIRVTLLISRLPERAQRFAEAWCLLFATVSIGFFAWFTVQMTIQSYEFQSLSQGMLGVSLWIPQLGMVIGVVLLEVAFLEECVRFLLGKPATYLEAHTPEVIE